MSYTLKDLKIVENEISNLLKNMEQLQGEIDYRESQITGIKMLLKYNIDKRYEIIHYFSKEEIWKKEEEK